jgi:threonyl-tRNA synthetase
MCRSSIRPAFLSRLPLRYGEFGSCHRNEPSGALHGLMRVRGFVQDDGHIFCTEDQIESEVTAFNALVKKVYADFGFNDVAVKLALRPESRVGRRGLGQGRGCAARGAARFRPGVGRSCRARAPSMARRSNSTSRMPSAAPGSAAPCRSISRCRAPRAEYVAEDNDRKVPVMLHRAILGSLERFIGILIENHAGALPLWLAPVQAVVLNISEKQADYAADVRKSCAGGLPGRGGFAQRENYL